MKSFVYSVDDTFDPSLIVPALSDCSKFPFKQRVWLRSRLHTHMVTLPERILQLNIKTYRKPLNIYDDHLK